MCCQMGRQIKSAIHTVVAAVPPRNSWALYNAQGRTYSSLHSVQLAGLLVFKLLNNAVFFSGKKNLCAT